MFFIIIDIILHKKNSDALGLKDYYMSIAASTDYESKEIRKANTNKYLAISVNTYNKLTEFAKSYNPTQYVI